MKYWLYSEGNILGPYDPAEMLALPAFAEESLICPENATGDNPGDWRPASQVGELASALSVGVGRTISAGAVAGAYDYETGFNSSVRYFEDKEPSPGSSYGELLDTIDNILGAYKNIPSEGKAAPETDYDLAEKFDIRLSHIQEELEAARWEKNLLLEKIRSKEMEEKKNRARIEELEARLKDERGKNHDGAKELEQVRHLADLKEKAETVRQIEEIKREELELGRDIAPDKRSGPAAEPLSGLHASSVGPDSGTFTSGGVFGSDIEVKSFKSISRGSEIKLETSLGKGLKEEADDMGLTSRRFKSLGQTQPSAYDYGSHSEKTQPGPEAATPASSGPEAFKPLPQQAGGVVYDFTVVTSKPSETQQFNIETRQEAAADSAPVKPPTFDFGITAKPAPAQNQPPQMRGGQFQPNSSAPASAPAPVPAQLEQVPAAVPAAAPAAAAAVPDKTARVAVPASKAKPDAKATVPGTKKGGRMAFIAILVAFGAIAAGGLGYFFMGEGGSFSTFSMINQGGRKKSAVMESQLEAKAEPVTAPKKNDAAPEPATRPVPPQQQSAPAEKPVSENIRKALDIVKGYKLSGGRGNVATWFANSFLSGASGGANEEWTATPLHGDIFVVQYRLLRPRQDPLIYQFEVDAAKRDIVRGINNNAIELLDFSAKEKSAGAAAAVKSAAKPRVRKTSKPGGIPILPLPDAPPSRAQREQDPTGFESSQAEGSDQVKYLKAQESDEELF